MLTGRRRTNTEPRPIPLGLLGALVLVVLGELHVDRHTLDYRSQTHWSCRMAASEAEAGATDSQLLCFGDSLLKLGIAPTVIEAATGMHGYNFAISGGQAPGSYFLLKRTLESGAQPKAILVDFFPSLLAIRPSFNEENWPMLANLAESVEYACIAGTATTFARLAARLTFPSIRNRKAVRSALVSALTGGGESARPEIEKLIATWTRDRGGEFVPCRPGVAENLDVWTRGYFPAFECSSGNRRYVAMLLDLAASRQIPVFWLLPPYQPALQVRVEQSGFDAQHERFVRRLQKEHPNLIVLDARHAGYTPEVFFDLHHLGREGATALSADVGARIARHLRELEQQQDQNNRWASLPPFHPRPDLVPPDPDRGPPRLLAGKPDQDLAATPTRVR